MDEILANKLTELHQFWFNEHSDWPSEDHLKRWYMGGEDFDKELIEKFSELPDELIKADTNDLVENNVRLHAAIVVALDQLPRNLFRKSAKAFAFDKHAMELAEQYSSSEEFKTLWPSEKLFVLMPYQHTEDLSLQDKSLTLFQALADEAPDEHKKMATGMYEYAKKHRDIVVQFGRFPHRNEVLGRETTTEEEKYLSDGAERFGQ